jgi:hypothetical protein
MSMRAPDGGVPDGENFSAFVQAPAAAPVT